MDSSKFVQQGSCDSSLNFATQKGIFFFHHAAENWFDYAWLSFFIKLIIPSYNNYTCFTRQQCHCTIESFTCLSKLKKSLQIGNYSMPGKFNLFFCEWTWKILFALTLSYLILWFKLSSNWDILNNISVQFMVTTFSIYNLTRQHFRYLFPITCCKSQCHMFVNLLW